MINRDVIKLLRKSTLPVYAGVLVKDDVIMVRVYKGDMIALLNEHPDSEAVDPSIQPNAIFLHNATE
jgi:hypothetical protein